MCMQMLVVSETKLNQLRHAISTWTRGVIVLRGPSGSGKRTALSHVCGELGHRLITSTPESGLVSFCSRLETLPHPATGHISAVVYSDDPDQLAQTVDMLSSFPHVLVVFSLSENDLRYKRMNGIFVISFSELSDTAIRKLVASCVSECTDADTIEEIVDIAAGDARQASVQIDMRNIRHTPSQSSHVKTKRKRRQKEPVCVNAAGRDNTFSLFHTLGKILYNKEGEWTDCEQLARQPVVADSGDVPLLILHENLPDFCGSLNSLVSISASLSHSDIYMRKGVRDDLQNWFVFKSFTILNEDRSERAVRGFAAFRRPRSKDSERAKQHSASDLTLVRSKVVWLDYRYLNLLDHMMSASGGSFPHDLPWTYKRRIYNLFRGIEENGVIDPNDAIDPKELDDDPLEDC